MLFLTKTRHEFSDSYPSLILVLYSLTILFFLIAGCCPVCSVSIFPVGLLGVPLLGTGTIVRDPWVTVAIFQADNIDMI